MTLLRFTLKAILLLALLFAQTATAVEQEPLSIFVSILPQKFLVERIGAEHVDVEVMVGVGQNPVTYEPLPQQMVKLSKAALYYRIGVQFETAWMGQLMANNPQLRLLDAREGIALREMEPAGGHHHDYDHSHSHEEERADPHIWLSPRRMLQMAERLTDVLIQLAPEHASSFRANHQQLQDELDQLDQALQAQFAPLKGRRFMVFHPSWGYFADDYRLQQVPIEAEGKEPGAKSLVRLIEQARREQVTTVFVQAQFAQGQAKALAEAVGARVVAIDPLAVDYIANMHRVAKAISGASR